MSRPQEPHRPFFLFGNPFKMILPNGSYLSPKLLELLNGFEEKLAERLRKLQPKDREDVLSLSWMRLVMKSLCETHTDIKHLITALELPVCDWHDKWIDIYLDNSMKLLDICNAFRAELLRLNQGQLLLQCALHNLNSTRSKQLVGGSSSLDRWRQHMNSRTPSLAGCFAIVDNLTETLNLPKMKNSAKGKVFMRAMYGVKVQTVFVCSIFAAAFSGSAKKMIDLQVRETCLWAESFTHLQAFVNGEVRNIYANGRVTVVKELEAVDVSVNKLYPIIHDGVGHVEAEEFQNYISDLGKRIDNLSVGLDILMKEVDGFFKIVLSGRDALICNFRVGGNVPCPIPNSEQAVRFI